MESPEVRELERTLDQARLSVLDLKPHLIDLFEPRQRPRPEVLVALQLLASRAGFPAQCSGRECRRSGRCQAQDVGAPLCETLWPEPLSRQFDDMVAGIELSAWCTERRETELHARLTRMFEEPAPTARRGKKRRDVGRVGRRARRPALERSAEFGHMARSR